MSEHYIAAVPVEMIDLVWDKVEPLVESVIAVSGGEVTTESTYKSLKQGVSLLVLICKGSEITAINTVEIRTLDSDMKVLYILLVSGSELDEWIDLFLEWVERLGKMNGCEELRGIASRKGWSKKMKSLGWEHIKTVVGIKI